MSGLSKPGKSQNTKFVAVTAAEIAPIDPLLELTQPGGPYPPGHSIVTDGMGGYVIESTLRPYFLSFGLDLAVPKHGARWLTHQGVDTEVCGPIIPLSANIVAITLSASCKSAKSANYLCEILMRCEESWKNLASYNFGDEDSRRLVIDKLSLPVPAKAELGVRLSQTEGGRKSKFDKLICLLELEN